MDLRALLTVLCPNFDMKFSGVAAPGCGLSGVETLFPLLCIFFALLSFPIVFVMWYAVSRLWWLFSLHKLHFIYVSCLQLCAITIRVSNDLSFVPWLKYFLVIHFSVVHHVLPNTEGRNRILSMEMVSSLEPTFFHSWLADGIYHPHLWVDIMQEPLHKSPLNLSLPPRALFYLWWYIPFMALCQIFRDSISPSWLSVRFL